MTSGLSEKWIDIPKLERRYKISSSGLIFNKKNKTLLKYKTLSSGHNQVTLYKNGKSKSYYVDRLVLRCFTNFNVDDPCEIIHLDGNNANDDINNLKLVNVLKKKTSEKKSLCKKIDETQLLEIIQKLKSGQSSRMISEDYPLSYRTIEKINKGESWREITWDLVDSYPIRKKIKLSKRNGSNSHLSKLTEEKVKEIKKLIKRRISNQDIARKFGVSESSISKIKSGENWAHVG